MAILWAAGTSSINAMRSSCAPSAGGSGCATSRVDGAHTTLVVGDVFLGVAVAGLATAAVLYLLRAQADAEASVHVETGLLPGGAYVGAGARF